MGDQITGEQLLVWSIRIAVGCYLARMVIVAQHGWLDRVPRPAEVALWTIGACLYVIHVLCAFGFVHDWSHAAAWEYTADETQRMVGVRRGDGLWVNYLFTAVWLADAIRLEVARSRSRPTRWRVDIVVHGFFAFIVFNATVVFGPAIYRIVFIPVVVVLFVVWKRGKQRP